MEHRLKLDKDLWTEVVPVRLDAEVYDVFDRFARSDARPFLPVVDADVRPIGVVRERDLKQYAYSRFGRDLVKRRHLSELVRPTLCLRCDVGLDDLLDATADSGAEGVVLTDQDGVYCCVLYNEALLKIFGQRHLENQVRVAQLQKMEAIGTLAGGIAHDLNNMLMPIIGYMELIGDAVRQGVVPDLGMIEDVYVSATRARETVKRIQSFSRHQTTERGRMKLGDSVREAVRLIQPSLPKTIDVDLAVQTDDDIVHANPGEMLQVLLNLCGNAAHAMKGKCGGLHITLAAHHGPLLGWSLSAERLDGEYVRISVADHGNGIPEDILPQIFVPFFTTKKQGEGTGMGLAVVHGIVSRCGGHISVETEFGLGSTFHVYLPIVRQIEGVAMKAPDKLPELRKPTNGDRVVRVLVVDDEVYITRLAKAALSRHGINVDTENDSCEAVKRIESRPDSFDALIVDQMMPGVTGIDVARRALALRPGLPVILCTGYTEGITPDEAKLEGVREFVLKPADFSVMANWIHGWTSPKVDDDTPIRPQIN